MDSVSSQTLIKETQSRRLIGSTGNGAYRPAFSLRLVKFAAKLAISVRRKQSIRTTTSSIMEMKKKWSWMRNITDITGTLKNGHLRNGQTIPPNIIRRRTPIRPDIRARIIQSTAKGQTTPGDENENLTSTLGVSLERLRYNLLFAGMALETAIKIHNCYDGTFPMPTWPRAHSN